MKPGYIVCFVFGLALGVLLPVSARDANVEEEQPETAAYLIGAVTITDPERLPEYRKIAEPLAHAVGGYEPLAFSEVTVLEGELPINARYFIERYDSRAGLNAFINSEGFKQARVLRDQVADVHFMLALDAISE